LGRVKSPGPAPHLERQKAPVYGWFAIQFESVQVPASPVGTPSYDLLRDLFSGL